MFHLIGIGLIALALLLHPLLGAAVLVFYLAFALHTGW